ncbi:NAD(P)-dependent oxidoreductase [Gaoshiqia sp. Z1-71]|uniref:NAD(P)-dependent oxidoreductase n=1 Tax=Gaoshiqia hydrogeniformans TaxID=3290090 RepID=UPI003BF82A32
MKVGVLRESRRYHDRRVAITPETARLIRENYPGVSLFVQSSAVRIHQDEEYSAMGIPVVNDVSHCDLLIGIKEVSEESLIEGKTYIMFAHVAKQQAFNRSFFKQMADKKITLLDYEYFTDQHHNRLVAFGFWAGVVGAYYAFQGAARRFRGIGLPRPETCRNLRELYHHLRTIKLPPLKILLTGGGRVASGALEMIHEMGIAEVLPKDFLEKDYDHPVYVRLDPEDYVVKKQGKFDRDDFYQNPADYSSAFLPYLKPTDIFIPCHFWDQVSPHFFTPAQLRSPDFGISLIADVSCDVPGPIPTTIRTSSIDNPFYDVDPESLLEQPAFSSSAHITVMAVDNLPTALPFDASRTFARDLYHQVLPSLFGEDTEGIIERATILKDGQLTEQFSYLRDFLEGET